jgi:hypothetical protein
MTYYTWVPGFSDIGRTREGTRFRITFALYVKKIFISRVCKCVTLNVFTMYRKKIYTSVCKVINTHNPFFEPLRQFDQTL